MVNPILKLREIIFEIVGKCENRCDYCGSKDIWDEEIDEDKIKKIVDKICLYPPEQINISGGDPLLVSRETHKYIIKKLKEQKIFCKILINPKSLFKENILNVDKINILELYDHIGISINTKEEELLVEKLFNDFYHNVNTTIITNFNMTNIFLFDKIKEFVKKQNLIWMVQYTVYCGKSEPLAIYNNEEAFEFLRNKIKSAYNENLKIMISDNMAFNECPAGTSGLGITYDGKVVPCLGMRSFYSDINYVVQGSLLEKINVDELMGDSHKENPLKYIWEHKFQGFRFCKFMCCKDQCKNKLIGEYNSLKEKGDDSGLGELKKYIDGTDGTKTIRETVVLLPEQYKRIRKLPTGVYMYAAPEWFEEWTYINISNF